MGILVLAALVETAGAMHDKHYCLPLRYKVCPLTFTKTIVCPSTVANTIVCPFSTPPGSRLPHWPVERLLRFHQGRLDADQLPLLPLS